jgi:hypothetical protein
LIFNQKNGKWHHALFRTAAAANFVLQQKNAPNGSVIFKLTRLRRVNAEYAMKIIDGRRGTDNALAVDR